MPFYERSEKDMKTIVISGAGGFLGRNLLSLADSNRFDVYALSSKIGDT